MALALTIAMALALALTMALALTLTMALEMTLALTMALAAVLALTLALALANPLSKMSLHTTTFLGCGVSVSSHILYTSRSISGSFHLCGSRAHRSMRAISAFVCGLRLSIFSSIFSPVLSYTFQQGRIRIVYPRSIALLLRVPVRHALGGSVCPCVHAQSTRAGMAQTQDHQLR